MEQWRPVLGYESSYEVSSLGRVRSLPRVVMRSNGRPLPVAGRVMVVHWNPKSTYPSKGKAKRACKLCARWRAANKTN